MRNGEDLEQEWKQEDYLHDYSIHTKSGRI